MTRGPPRSPLSSSSAASDVYKRQSVYCATCDCCLCSECSTAAHALRVMQRHVLEPMSEREAAREKLCPVHYEPLQLVCMDCDCLCCWQCKDKAHRGHSHQKLSGLTSTMREQLEGSLDRLSVLANTAEGTAAAVDKVSHRLGAPGAQTQVPSASAVILQISEHFEALRLVLAEREKELKEAVEDIQQHKIARLEEQRAQLGIFGTQVEMVEFHVHAVLRGSNTQLCERFGECAGLVDELVMSQLPAIPVESAQIPVHLPELVLTELQLHGIVGGDKPPRRSPMCAAHGHGCAYLGTSAKYRLERPGRGVSCREVSGWGSI
eukprot:TRINITY_DN6955_c0_g1_i1.p1 TRINITY_DN6955_c0_g1~~TRINITY_DN6955_c0_g1_i1.p1  ORF type:complete len:321 (-),score=60.57 TRINITY_DN6955_c0_g1_i1:64-1026(-)